MLKNIKAIIMVERAKKKLKGEEIYPQKRNSEFYKSYKRFLDDLYQNYYELTEQSREDEGLENSDSPEIDWDDLFERTLLGMNLALPNEESSWKIYTSRKFHPNPKEHYKIWINCNLDPKEKLEKKLLAHMLENKLDFEIGWNQKQKDQDQRNKIFISCNDQKTVEEIYVILDLLENLYPNAFEKAERLPFLQGFTKHSTISRENETSGDAISIYSKALKEGFCHLATYILNPDWEDERILNFLQMPQYMELIKDILPHENVFLGRNNLPTDNNEVFWEYAAQKTMNRLGNEFFLEGCSVSPGKIPYDAKGEKVARNLMKRGCNIYAPQDDFRLIEFDIPPYILQTKKTRIAAITKGTPFEGENRVISTKNLPKWPGRNIYALEKEWEKSELTIFQLGKYAIILPKPLPEERKDGWLQERLQIISDVIMVESGDRISWPNPFPKGYFMREGLTGVTDEEIHQIGEAIASTTEPTKPPKTPVQEEN